MLRTKKGDEADEFGEITRAILARDDYRGDEADDRSAAKNDDLACGTEPAPELIKQEEYARRERQRSEKRGNAHAERELLLLLAAVDVESATKLIEQALVIVIDGRLLVVAEAEYLLARELGQFILEGVDLVGTFLGCSFG